MQETGVQSLVQEGPTGCGAIKPMSHNYWACALGLGVSTTERMCPRACAQQNKHHNEKPLHHEEAQPPLVATRENPMSSNEDQYSQKLKQIHKSLKKKKARQ